MKIAIISDTHDDVVNTKKCLEQLKKRKITNIFHLGDFCSPFMIDLFKEYSVSAVLGNNDADVFRIMTKIKDLNFELNDQLLEISVEDYKVALYHGTSQEIINAIIKSQEYKVFFHGHTHQLRNEQIGNTLVLNPGTINKNLSKDESSTYMLFDTKQLSVEIIKN